MAFLWSLGLGAIAATTLRAFTDLTWPWIALLAAAVGLLVLAAFLSFRPAPSGSSPRSGPTPDGGCVDPEDLARYLDDINRTMEEKGFGRNSNLPSEPASAEGPPLPTMRSRYGGRGPLFPRPDD